MANNIEIEQRVSQIVKRLSEVIQSSHKTYAELEMMTGIPRSTLQRYATGQTRKIPIAEVEIIARAVKILPSTIMGWQDDYFSLLPIPPIPPSSEEALIEHLRALDYRLELTMDENYLITYPDGYQTDIVDATEIQKIANLMIEDTIQAMDYLRQFNSIDNYYSDPRRGEITAIYDDSNEDGKSDMHSHAKYVESQDKYKKDYSDGSLEKDA
jgi:transcriptional regulator with XRE-family HTH domain